MVLSLGFPMLYTYIQVNRLYSASSQMTSALIAARTTAVEQNHQVVLCSSIDGALCSKDGVWENGFLYFVDADKNGRMSGAERAMQFFPAIDNGATIRSNFQDSHRVVYLPSGQVKATDYFNVCINNVPANGRSIELNITGRPNPQSGAERCPDDGISSSASLVAHN